MKNFGSQRSLEPKGSLPVVAWKVDNRRKLNPGEVRLAVHSVVAEENNLQQLYSLADQDDTKVRERIMKILEERGKFHNPYTKSGGVLMGIVEEVAPGFAGSEIKVGDNVISLSSIAGLPLALESIENIDYNYNLIHCTGHAICFETTVLIKYEKPYYTDSTKYLLRALDEEGSFYNLNTELHDEQVKTAAIIGNSLPETILYAQLLKDQNPQSRVILLTEGEQMKFSDITEEDLFRLLHPLVDKIYIEDMSQPGDTVTRIARQEGNPYVDLVVNLEDTVGCESVAALFVREGGMIFHVNLGNNYTREILISDSLGKNVVTWGWDGIGSPTFEYAEALTRRAEPVLKKLDRFFETHAPKKQKEPVREERNQMAAKQIDNFIYMSPVTANMVEDILNVAQYDCNVIIQGETGVGKERVFNLLQQNSPRKTKPCVKINCATIQENLAESEFFGYEKGAFTGAQSSGKEGYFEVANNGTIFLDEIGSLSLSMQSKLLRVLQENTFYRVGGTEPKRVDVRVICANNVPLKKLVDEGKFREDLFYRLNICLIEVPPLRKRKEDIYCLSQAFMKNYSQKYGIDKDFSPEAYRQLEVYHWPGNVRELENTVHRLYIASKDLVIEAEAVDELINDNVYDDNVINIKREVKKSESMDLNQIMEEQERRLIAFALKKEGTTRRAAEFLNIPQTTLARKKIKYNL